MGQLFSFYFNLFSQALISCFPVLRNLPAKKTISIALSGSFSGVGIADGRKPMGE